MFLYVSLVPSQALHALLDGGEHDICLSLAAVKLEQLTSGGVKQLLQGVHIVRRGVARAA